MKKKNASSNGRDRFSNWKPPRISEGRPNKYGWVVQHKKNFKLGKNTDIGIFTYINAKNGVEIGNDAQVGSHCSIYSVSTIDNKQGKVILGKNCKVGSHCVIMPGVKIGEDAVIGAHSYVNRDIPESAVAYGVPARIVKKRSSAKKGKNK